MDTDSDTPQRPKANDGGCRLRNAVLPILALAAFSIAVVCVTPLAVAFVDRVDIDTQDRQQVITRAVSQSVQDFFHSMEQMPFHASAFSTLSVTNLRDINATQRLLLALQLQCETCTYVYYGLSDGFFGSMAPTADARYKQFCYPISIPGGHQYCCNTDAQTGVCTAPAADTNEIYNPVIRPWYQQLVQRDQWSSLYPSFAKPTTVSTTVGGPILDVPTNTVIGAFAADVNFATLQASISAMALTTSDSGGYALYEATSLYVIFASFDDRPRRQVVTLADLKNVSLGTNFNDLSDDDLVSNVSVSKTLGAPFFRRYLSVVPLVNITGLDLRIVTVFLEAPISESARYSLGLSAGLGLGLVVAMSITVAVVTVFVVERPLHLLADRMRAGVVVAMGTEDALEDIPPSKPYLKELIEIQESFDVMTYELHRLRAFVPKSFLIDSMEAFEDEGEPEQYNNTLRNVRVDEALLGAAADDDDQQPGSPRRNSQLSSISSSATPARQASPTPPGGSATQRQFVMVGPPSPRGDQGTHDSPAVVGAAAPPPVGQSTVRFTHLLGVVNTKLATKRWLNRSQTSAKTSPNAPAAIGRRFHKDIKQAAVTLATIRLRHVDAVLKCGRDPRFGSDVLALVASVFECAATRHGGVIDHYSGDRVTIAFNAHRPTSGHRRSSIECILTISRLLTELSVPRSGRIDVTLNRQSAEWEQKDASDPLHQQPAASAASSASETVRVRPCWRGVSSGVASGNATVGNVGSDTLTRFAIMSECVDASAALEMRCRQVEFDDGSGLPCVCSGTYAPDIGFSVAYQTIDVIKTNHAGRMETTIAPMRMLLAKPSGSPPQRDDGNDSEWMYELQRAQEANEFNDVNAGFDAFAAGRLNEARAALARAEARSDRVSAQVGIARLRELVLVGAAGEP